MRALDRKLRRDLWRLRGQVLAVALVIASGTALLVMALSAHTSLRSTAEAYYERYRFAEVFAGVKRAPERLAARIADIPGVQTVETRVTALSTVDVADVVEPVTGTFRAAVSKRSQRTPPVSSHFCPRRSVSKAQSASDSERA